MAAELIIGPLMGLLIFGWGVFFASLVMYRQQQREEKFARLRAQWEGLYQTPQNHRLLISWLEDMGWVATLADAPPRDEPSHFPAQMRGDTMTVTLGESGVALDLRFLEDDLLVSPLVPGLHGDTSVEPVWLEEILRGSAPRWRRA